MVCQTHIDYISCIQVATADWSTLALSLFVIVAFLSQSGFFSVTNLLQILFWHIFLTTKREREETKTREKKSTGKSENENRAQANQVLPGGSSDNSNLILSHLMSQLCVPRSGGRRHAELGRAGFLCQERFALFRLHMLCHL